jgi:hypothetical protein
MNARMEGRKRKDGREGGRMDARHGKDGREGGREEGWILVVWPGCQPRLVWLVRV